MNKSLRDRIDLANKYIKFAMDRQIWGLGGKGYFGASYPMLIEYTQPIKVTPSGNFVTVEYIDRASPEWPSNFSVHKERYNIHPGNVNSEERIGDLRYEISNYIVKAIKNGARAEGYGLALGRAFARRRRNAEDDWPPEHAREALRRAIEATLGRQGKRKLDVDDVAERVLEHPEVEDYYDIDDVALALTLHYGVDRNPRRRRR